MTKRFLVISSIALAIIIATVTTIIVICVNNRDTYTEDDGTFVATPATTERLYEILEENDSQRLKIDFSKIDVYSDVAISDKTNREVLILNGGGLYFEEFSIVTNAKNLVITNLSVKNANNEVLVMNGSYVTLSVKSCFFDVEKEASAVRIDSEKCILALEDTSKFYGGDGEPTQNGASGLVANELTINVDENAFGTLYIHGGKAGIGIDGQDGKDGYSYSPSTQHASWGSGRDGSSGGNGTDATKAFTAGQGGDALVCDQLTVCYNVVLKCYGGGANKSGDGAHGGDGGCGEGASTGHPVPIKSYDGGRGGDAGDGSDGGDEIRPGAGINADTIIVYSSSSVTSKRGERGTAGVAGRSGVPGSGGWGSESSMTNWHGPKQASSGSRGADGKDGRTLDDNEIFDYIINKINGDINID